MIVPAGLVLEPEKAATILDRTKGTRAALAGAANDVIAVVRILDMHIANTGSVPGQDPCHGSATVARTRRVGTAQRHVTFPKGRWMGVKAPR